MILFFGLIIGLLLSQFLVEFLEAKSLTEAFGIGILAAIITTVLMVILTLVN